MRKIPIFLLLYLKKRDCSEVWYFDSTIQEADFLFLALNSFPIMLTWLLDYYSHIASHYLNHIMVSES